jgi:hypothetical protein
MTHVTSKPFTPIFRSKLSIYKQDTYDGILKALGEILRRSEMPEDYPEIPNAAMPASEALIRTLERASDEVHYAYRRMTAVQLARVFARALNVVGNGPVMAFEEFFRAAVA